MNELNTEMLNESLAQLEEKFKVDPQKITVELKNNILHLGGEADTWQQVVELCHAAAKLEEIKNVVNHITTPDSVQPEAIDTAPYEAMGVVKTTDVLIIGGGVSGCGIARQLSKYKLDILLIEKESDLCEGTTKCNNGMIHSGYDNKPTSLKAKLCVKGNAMYTQWANELGFCFKRTGSFVAGFNEADMETIRGLYENGVKNGVPGIEILDGDQSRAIEPGMSDGVIGSLWTPSAGYVEPYEVALALAENAVDNGAQVMLNTKVLAVLTENGAVSGVVTNQGIIKTKILINAAGLYADEIAKMAGDECYTIHARRGTLVILDKENAGKLHTFIGKAPSNYTKGGGPQETPEGTLIWGPSAKEVSDKANCGVDRDDLDFILEKGVELTKNISTDTVITYFGGSRAATFTEDFVIENSEVVKGFIHVGGIQSPGLASSPAIAEYVEDLFLQQMPDAPKNEAYNPLHTCEKPMRDCTDEERKAKIAENPAYGKVICRCETVTEGEILAAIHGKIPAHTVDAVKRRTRAGMGRCQGGFCGSRVLEILARELGVSPTQITQKGEGSAVLFAPTRTSKGGL